MAKEKLYAGTKLRELRRDLNLTQREFAQKLDVSLPYLNQMENNNRPLSANVVLGLAQVFGFDVTELSSGDSTRLIHDLREAAADPILQTAPPPLHDLRMAANNAPGLARAFLDLHSAYRQSQERLASLDAALGHDGKQAQPAAWDEVRDFFHYCDNYIDPLDRAAERLAQSFDDDSHKGIAKALADQSVTVAYTDSGAMRHYDQATRTLSLNPRTPQATQNFQMLFQLALLSQNELIEASLDLARFQNPSARDIAKLGMANYFAGAALMPYGPFLRAAQTHRHDLEVLASLFGASIEQIAHRLSTLQRVGAKGIPFFFVRVDQAGTITKRHSATALQFARFGGACPLWNVHRAFETPGQFLRQLAQTPDGKQYFCLARDISKPSGAWGAPVRRFAIGMGCEVKHAEHLVYADTMDTQNSAAFEAIGISCRICERQNCHQRSVPPMEQILHVNPDMRGTLPYEIG